MVRKEGYFSITDACIKHWGANFLIMRPPPQKKPLEFFCAKWGGEEECGGHWGDGGERSSAAARLGYAREQPWHQPGRVLVEINLPRDIFLWRGDDFQGSGLLVAQPRVPGWRDKASSHTALAGCAPQ